MLNFSFYLTGLKMLIQPEKEIDFRKNKNLKEDVNSDVYTAKKTK